MSNNSLPLVNYLNQSKPVRTARAMLAFGNLARDPNKLGMVFELADSMSDPVTVQSMADHFSRHEVGRLALAERPRLRFDLNLLDTLPEGTFGRSFANHMRRNNLDPTALPSLPINTTHDFVRAHLYDSHDIWHAVTGFQTDVAGELGLQAFYLAQFPAKLAAGILAAGLINTLLFAFDQRDQRMDEIARGWQMGREAKPFFGVRWDHMWSMPLEDVRSAMQISPRLINMPDTSKITPVPEAA